MIEVQANHFTHGAFYDIRMAWLAYTIVPYYLNFSAFEIQSVS